MHVMPAGTGSRQASIARLLALGVCLAVASCTDSRPPREHRADSTSAVAPAPWYSNERSLDLTGDGEADLARLVATGTRPDSLRITLRLLVDGEQKFEEWWGSSYELAVVDSATRTGPMVDSVLRAALDSVLASVVLQRLDAPGVQVMAEDSAVLAELEPRPTHRVSFSYGYETTVRVVWDAPRARFVQLWSCC